MSLVLGEFWLLLLADVNSVKYFPMYVIYVSSSVYWPTDHFMSLLNPTSLFSASPCSNLDFSITLFIHRRLPFNSPSSVLSLSSVSSSSVSLWPSELVCMSWLRLLWILSCNRQCAALVSDVCMTCFPPDPISGSQAAFSGLSPARSSCSQPHGVSGGGVTLNWQWYLNRSFKSLLTFVNAPNNVRQFGLLAVL